MEIATFRVETRKSLLIYVKDAMTLLSTIVPLSLSKCGQQNTRLVQY